MYVQCNATISSLETPDKNMLGYKSSTVAGETHHKKQLSDIGSELRSVFLTCFH